MSSDDDVLLGPASGAEPPDGLSDDILLPGDHAGIARGERVREPLAIPMAGRFTTWIVRPPDEYMHPARTVLGVAAVQWNVEPYSDEAAESHVAVNDGLPGHACTVGRAPFLEYRLKQVFMLNEQVSLHPDFHVRSGPLGAGAVAATRTEHRFQGGFGIDDIVGFTECAVNTVLLLSAVAAENLQHGVCDILVASVVLGPRLPRGGLPGGFPSTKIVKRVRQRFGTTRTRTTVTEGPETYSEWKSRYDAVLLKMPLRARDLGTRRDGTTRADAVHSVQEIDPLRLLRGLGVTQYLRSSIFFKMHAGCEKVR